ncbi:hypothetical protein D3C81_2227120 [compost metagenome]
MALDLHIPAPLKQNGGYDDDVQSKPNRMVNESMFDLNFEPTAACQFQESFHPYKGDSDKKEFFYLVLMS